MSGLTNVIRRSGLAPTSALARTTAARSGKRVFSAAASEKAAAASSSSAASLPQHLLNVPPTKYTTLDNGFTVASETHHGETATVGVYIDAGSSYETAKTNGAAHFLEHLAFKGTNRRTRRQLEVEVENMGAHLNAYTSREQTVYFANLFKGDLAQGVDILADILTNSQLDQTSIEAERDVILREMREVEQNTEEVVFDHLHSVAYQGTPLGFTILGPKENILGLQRDDLQQYIDTHYTAPRMVLVGAGAVEHEQLVDIAQKAFGGLPTQSKTELPTERPPVEYTGSMVEMRDDDFPLIHMAIAQQSVGWSHPDYFTFLVLQQICGAWDRQMGGADNQGSYVVEQLTRNEVGAHSLVHFNTPYHDTGLFGAYLTCERHSADDVIYHVMNNWVRLSMEANDSEVARAKNAVKANLLMQNDGTQAICEDIGRQSLTLGRRLTPAETFLRIDSISTSDVRRVAYEYLNDQCPAVAALGPTEEVPTYPVLRGFTYWNRA